MISALTRFTFVVCLALIATFISLYNWGAEYAIFIGVFLLSVPLVNSYINLARLGKYVQSDSIESMPLPSGFWEEVFFRLQRLVKTLKQRIRNIEQQHENFIEAFQASPNGILMLDESDQIEWCNSISERFFGLIFKRDVMQRINFLIRRPEFIHYLINATLMNPYYLKEWVQIVVLV
jgi:two-component system phosphate regulon sensor histidine kinase PhoR